MAFVLQTLTDVKHEHIAARRGKRRKLVWGCTRADRESFKPLLAQLELGLEDRMSTKVGLLSGGQRQRAYIAMALAQDTDIILLDEPTTHLDLNRQFELLELIREYGTVILHRHERPDGDAMGSQIGLKQLILENLPGKTEDC